MLPNILINFYKGTVENILMVTSWPVTAISTHKNMRMQIVVHHITSFHTIESIYTRFCLKNAGSIIKDLTCPILNTIVGQEVEKLEAPQHRVVTQKQVILDEII